MHRDFFLQLKEQREAAVSRNGKSMQKITSLFFLASLWGADEKQAAAVRFLKLKA